MHDTVNPAGQYRHGPARPSTASRSILKLGDYVDHVKDSEERTGRLNASKKLSFDEWYDYKYPINQYNEFPELRLLAKKRAEEVWKAAQENK